MRIKPPTALAHMLESQCSNTLCARESGDCTVTLGNALAFSDLTHSLEGIQLFRVVGVHIHQFLKVLRRETLYQEHPESYRVAALELTPPTPTSDHMQGSLPDFLAPEAWRLPCRQSHWSGCEARPVFGFTWAGTSPSCLVMLYLPWKNAGRDHWGPAVNAPVRPAEHGSRNNAPFPPDCTGGPLLPG